MLRLLLVAALTLVSCHPRYGADDWGYRGVVGPSAWAQLSPTYDICARGRRQSPIDLARADRAGALPPLALHYHLARVGVRNTGRAIELLFDDAGGIEIDGKAFALTRIVLHHPAEHTVGGRSFPLEAQLVHQAEDGSVATVAILLDSGTRNPALAPYLTDVPPPTGVLRPTDAHLDPAALYPIDRSYFRYTGSQTTPPCTEGVIWTVFATPVPVADAQVAAVARAVGENARPAQPLSDRSVFYRP